MFGLNWNSIAYRLSVWFIGSLLVLGLYGNPITRRSTIRYTCPRGPHFVDSANVMKRDVAGRPLCPIHNIPMSRTPN